MRRADLFILHELYSLGHAMTGVFVDNAQNLIAYPAYTDEDLLKKFSYTANDALSYGITTVHDAKLDPKEIDFFRRCATSRPECVCI